MGLERPFGSGESTRGAQRALCIETRSTTVGRKIRGALRESEAWYRETGEGYFHVLAPVEEMSRVAEHLGLWLDSVDLDACHATVMEAEDEAPPHSLAGAPTLRAVIAEEWRTCLQRLIEEDRLVVRLQPIVQTAHPKLVVGHESFLRGLSMRNLIVLPERLLDAAERDDRLLDLDEAARRRAFTEVVECAVDGLIFVNASPHTVCHEKTSYVATTIATAREAKLDPRRIVVEIGRGQRAQRRAELAGLFAECRDAGLAVAFDDVGTTPAIRALVEDLRPDYVKVDRHLVSFVDRDPEKQSAVLEVLRVARAAGARTVGVGVEREEELAWLGQAGVDLVQGYYIALPASPRSGPALAQRAR